ncbi:MAG: carbamoyl phosphate synthase large subunit, partial [Leptospiraceae bacterium]|nr:carbamoyl phosphate synthase large subunit [Leptospiraceae bacterium]
AIEIDVDAVADGKHVFVSGIMQHIEEAGVHSGDSACMLPPIGLQPEMIQEIKTATERIALELNVVGLLNIQYAIQKNKLYVIEVNPRASRTVPFVSKSIGIPIANIATQIMMGKSIAELGLPEMAQPDYISVKEAVLPFNRFPGTDIILSPEMKSTGEVMGIARTSGEAYLKAIIGAGEPIPASGGIFFSVNDQAKPMLVKEAQQLQALGFVLYGTYGTARYLKDSGVEVIPLHKMRDNRHPNPLDEMRRGNINLVINIPEIGKTRDDAFVIRQEAIKTGILCVTTLAGTMSLVNGLVQMRDQSFSVHSLQSIHKNS